jgi:hypothetical protein
MIRLDRGMVSLSVGRVVREKRPTGPYTASPIPPSQRRDLERAWLHPTSLIIVYSAMNSHWMSRVYLFVLYQTNNSLSDSQGRGHLCFLGMIGPRLAEQAVNLRSPKGAPKAQRLTANARAKRQSACHEAPPNLPISHAQQLSHCSSESLFHQSTCDGESQRSCEPPRPWRASCRASWRQPGPTA